MALGTKVEDVEAGKDSVKLKYGKESAEVELPGDRRGSGPDAEALKLRRGWGRAGGERADQIDEIQRTTKPGIYAIGDLVRGPALAHKAQEEGVVAVETMRATDPPVSVNLIPGEPSPTTGRQRRPDRGPAKRPGAS